MEVLIPFVTASIIDRGIEAGDIHQVYLYGGVMLAMALLSLACGVLAGRYAAKASSGLACSLREGIYEKVQSFAFSNIDSYSAAGLVARMTTDVTNVHNACQMILRIAVRAPLMLVCSIAMCFFISVKLSMIFLAAIVILAAALASVALIYGAGILCAYAYNRIMVNVSQGTMRSLRTELFQRMERLPIRYFDTHAHGDIMSVYTNDADTLRQLMGQSIPQVIRSGVTIAASFVSMFLLNIPLTVITLAVIGAMVLATSKIAAKLASADGFIRRLLDGYRTALTGDGANLSQGQRQLPAIARAAVAGPPVLILDEAASSIDTRTEALVQQGMDALMAGRTTFVIAHRLSTVKNADCIMVLEQGRIIERGAHDELIAQKGRYYQLYTGHAVGA